MQGYKIIQDKKISGKNFMTQIEKIYHIYAGDRCLFHSIKEEEFNTTWSTLKIMVGLMKTDYTIEDLSYEELTFNKDLTLHSSH